VLIASNDPETDSTSEFTVEGATAFVVVLVADIVLLVVSGRFPMVPRELVRWLGGAVLALVVLLILFVVVLSGLINLIKPATSRYTGKTSKIRAGSLIACGLCALGVGALLGTSVVIGGPVDFTPDVVLLVAAGWVWHGRGRPSRWPAGRHLLAACLALAGATAAVVGVLLLQYA
jgi:hypothetical protein